MTLKCLRVEETWRGRQKRRPVGSSISLDVISRMELTGTSEIIVKMLPALLEA